jgi:ribulose 1,5-bisphosphate synthetase/thiazole synthase
VILEQMANVLQKGEKMSKATSPGEGKPSEAAMAEKAWLPVEWDKVTDVVIVGYGATGAVAAITVSEAGD